VSGRLRESFACGTAAVLTPLGTIRSADGDFVIGNGQSAVLTERLKAALIDIQRCRAKDPHGWVHRIL
jgi:branched-chain amino acid aminotransferase